MNLQYYLLASCVFCLIFIGVDLMYNTFLYLYDMTLQFDFS